MKTLGNHTRRTAVTALAVFAALPALALTAGAAQAGPTTAAGTDAAGTATAAASGAAAKDGNASTRPAASNEALAAGKARHGARATVEQSLAAYWTPARLRAATPVEESARYAELVRQEIARQQAGGTVPAASGTTARKVEPKRADGGPAAAAYNPNFGVGQTTARTNGKVFFTMNGGNYSCSASVVNSEGADTVWTAGHCVHGGQGGSWAYNWTFVPNYDDDLANPAPYGYWYANHLWTKSSWINSSDFTSDMGVAIMNTKDGWHIVNYFGGHGFAVNQGLPYIYAFGYPAESPFDGGNLWYCPSGTSTYSTQVLRISCNMTRGSSGGPWLRSYDGNYGYLNGVNSRIDRIVNPTIMLSPYFDDTAWSLYDATRYL